ncbi:hypothetical protein FB451DRAFT_1007885, partial [Mycena latifolia]
FVRGQLKRAEPVVTADLTGKTVLVLGANTGIGFEAMKHFATMNPGRPILACWSESKGQAAVESTLYHIILPSALTSCPELKAATSYATAEV